jgi:glycosyltransferase involved in cell wall biosynthesis
LESGQLIYKFEEENKVMTVNSKSKKCIVLSQGPPPTPEHTKVEGGGLRCWGLAKGLKAANSNLDMTVAYHDSYRSDDFTSKHEKINLCTWDIDNVGELIQGYDTVVVSYCMGDLSVKVADVIRPDQQLVLDCYVPIYVEVSARNAEDVEAEYHAFHNDAGRWAHVLRRGDLFLCASKEQKKYYLGVLSAVGRINPITYDQDLILITPYGIYRDDVPTATHAPITKLIKENGYKKILWFGGIYPWFDLRNLVEAAAQVSKKIPSKLVIVGAKNPFNTHPDFVKRYDELVDFINSKKEYQELVVFQDWVKFEDRANWYLDSDLVVVANKEGQENKLAWRTRLVDFMWADLPVITNGGDPLGEELIENGAAARFTSLEADDMSKDIIKLLESPQTLQTMQKNMGKLKKDYYWDVVTSRLAELVSSHERASDLERFGSVEIIPAAPGGVKGKAKKVVRKARELPGYTKRHGVRNTSHAIATIASRKIGNRINKKTRNPKVLFFAHQLDRSGAPTVFMDALQNLLDTKKLPVEFHTFNPAHKDNIARLNKLGIKPKLHLNREISYNFVAGDVIVFNTVAHSGPMKEAAFNSLESNEANKLIWYIHEDEPELIFSGYEKKRISKLLKDNKIVIFIAAKRTAENYRKYFNNTTNIRIQDHRLVYDKKYHKVREASDFDRIRFILPGAVADGRKGQLPVLYALTFLQKYLISKDTATYRDYSLTYVGLGNDFLSRQIQKHAKKALGAKFRAFNNVSHAEIMKLDMDSNMTICYSLRECLPLFVFEGMITGHPLLRNDSSGVDEQLKEGKNGYLLPSDDIVEMAEIFERVLNKKKTSNKLLASMSEESYEIAHALKDKTYEKITREIISSYTGKHE